MPREARAVYFSRILFPTKECPQEVFDDSKKLVMDRILPLENVRDEGQRREIENCREALDTYLSSCTIAEQRLLMAATVVSSEPTEHEATVNIGKVLGQTLPAMGPAEGKSCQAGHSHHKTPTHIREGMESSKYKATSLTRWQQHELLEKHYDHNDDIAIVDELLGTGAYGAAIGVTKWDGSKSAITILKPYVEQQAKYGFGILGKTAQELVQKTPAMRPLLEMLEQARHSSLIETDMAQSEKQAHVASSNYDGLKINVEGHDFKFHNAAFIGRGKRYKETERVPGVDFLRIPSGNGAGNESRAYKRKMAIARITADLYIIATGKPFDDDDHGGQDRSVKESEKETWIGRFDNGGQATEPPSNDELKALSQVLRASYQHFSQKASFEDAFDEAIESAPEQTKPFMARVRRTVLAWGDFMRHLEKDDFKKIVTAILKADAVHPELQLSRTESIALSAQSMFKGLFGGGGETITIAEKDPHTLSALQTRRAKPDDETIRIIDSLRRERSELVGTEKSPPLPHSHQHSPKSGGGGVGNLAPDNGYGVVSSIR